MSNPAPAVKTATLMIQGAGSNVGKSLIVAGLCRHYFRQGLSVRPFKPQNMSNNAAATSSGGEIGRAQALQAKAAGVAPSSLMNPVLLKPESECGAQIIVNGERRATMSARDYGNYKAKLLPEVLKCFSELKNEVDIAIVEGAGSPAEINLREGDIANMGFAEAADVPVVLVGDIDRGGVIASLVGTYEVLQPEERARIKGFIINKFRGDVSLFSQGADEIAQRTGWPCLGIVPHFADASHLPAEDSLDLENSPSPRPNQSASARRIHIVVPRLPRIANFDDLDPLRLEPGVEITMIADGEPLPADADLVLLAGSKSTLADLECLYAQGWDIDIKAHHRRGGAVMGLCGGFQMLGRLISDPLGFEGRPRELPGLGLLNIETELGGDKRVAQISGQHIATGEAISGYEIHLGQSVGPDRDRGMFSIGGHSEGAISADGLVSGTYVHGAFTADGFRQKFLNSLKPSATSGSRGVDRLNYDAMVEDTLERLASHLGQHLDLEALAQIAGPGPQVK